MTKSQFKKGFTLIETIIYIGIIAIIIGSFLIISEQIIFSSNRTRRQIELTENQKFLIQKINWLLRNVDTVNTPLPNASSTILSINKVNFSENPLILNLADNVVYLNDIPLTNNSVLVTNLTFYQLTLPGQNAIRMTANIQNDVASSTIDRFILIK